MVDSPPVAIVCVGMAGEQYKSLLLYNVCNMLTVLQRLRQDNLHAKN